VTTAAIIYLDNNNPVDHHAQEVMMSSTLRATLLFFLVSTNPAAAFNNHRIVNTASHSKNNNNSCYKSSELNLYNSVEEAIGEAQRICSEQGGDSEACRVAWDIVEELEAADAHRTPAHPTTQQELSYGPLILSLDLLSAKIDRKMDELNKLSQSLVEAGAGPEVERLAYASEEMKGILEEAVRSLDMYR
jgi:hypothetical protein